MKRALTVFGLLGLVSCFLPLALGVSLFDARHIDGLAVYTMMAAFALPAVLGLAERLPGEAKLVSLGCFGYLLLYKMGTGVFDLIFHASIGGILMAVAAIGGFVASLGVFAED